MSKIKYYKIEKLKYKHSKIKMIYFLFALVSLFVTSVNIYKTQGSITDPNIMIFSSLHSLLFMQVLFLPLLIAVITSKSVELEEEGDMFKIIISSGINLDKIYNVKLKHILKSFTIYAVVLWLFIILELHLLGFPCFTMPVRLLIMFISFLLISYFIILIHYNIAIIKGKHLFNLSLALLGSLLGFISLFFMKIPIIPYSWYAVISSVQYIKNSSNTFSLELVEPSKFPATISITLIVIVYIFGKKLFLRRQYD